MKTDSRIPDCVRDQLPLPLPSSLPIFTNHHELRRDVGIDCSSPVLTDQSFANSCDINVIMAQYAKTGMLPQSSMSDPRYIDNTLVPSFERVCDIVSEARIAFDALPAPVRSLCGNNPENLESVLTDPFHRQFLVDQGVLVVDKPAQVSSSLEPEVKPQVQPPVG